MEGRAFRNSPVSYFSIGACLPRWRVTRDAASGQNPGTPRQRGQKAVTVQDFNCGHMRVPALTLRSKRHGSGWKNYYKFVLSAGAKVEEIATKPSLRRGKNRPAFSIKKRETPYPYCPCYKQAFFIVWYFIHYHFMQEGSISVI